MHGNYIAMHNIAYIAMHNIAYFMKWTSQNRINCQFCEIGKSVPDFMKWAKV